MEDALVPASSKDGGLTPGQLAWVLSQITVGSDARIPADVAPAELRTYLEDLVSRLTRLAWPATPAWQARTPVPQDIERRPRAFVRALAVDIGESHLYLG